MFMRCVLSWSNDCDRCYFGAMRRMSAEGDADKGARDYQTTLIRPFALLLPVYSSRRV